MTPPLPGATAPAHADRPCQTPPPLPHNHHQPPPVVWSIAGSDSGGGAGLQADLRALDALGVHGCTAVAALTAQNSVEVRRIEAVSPTMLDAQLAALAADMPPAALKTGLLGSTGNLRVLARWIDRLRQSQPDLPVVIDPVLCSSTGATFADERLVAAYREWLLPRATLITPNRDEAAQLLGLPADASPGSTAQMAGALRALGCQSVLITGGDARGRQEEQDSDRYSHDYLHSDLACGWMRLPRVPTPHHHGTGCVLASAAAAALARGYPVPDATLLAKMCTTQALQRARAAGRGAGPVCPAPGFASRPELLPAFSLDGHPLAAPDALGGGGFPPLLGPQADLGLYAVVDDALWVERVLAAGVRTVQLRIKDGQHPRLREHIRRAVAAARQAGAQLYVNDHWALAIEEGAWGVHLGQEDLAQADLHALAQAGLRLGISTHSYWEVCRAVALRPSYIACGPIHATQSKDMPWLPQGDGNLNYWSRLLPMPVVGIAGMNEARAEAAAAHGAAGVAVISAITAAPDVPAAIARLQQAIERGRRQPRPEPPDFARPTLPPGAAVTS